ncbi:MAG: hypothetical protein M3Z16_03050 [Pseudomonadota bacterium]|nr:hypothetical protein [Pseudomonadota bacterium]
MQASSAFWHLVNFVLPALVTAGLTTLLTRRLLARRIGFMRSWAIASGAALGGSFLALVLFAHDGTIAGYGLSLLSCAAALAWSGRDKVG